MKFRFKLLAVVIIAVLIIIIYKFGVNENIEAEEEEKQSYYQTETVYLGYSDDAFTDFYTSAAVAFHEQNPDIRVIPKLIEDDEYIESINDLSVEGTEFPDVYVITNDTLEKAYLAGLASENTKSTNVVNDAHFPKAAISAVTYSDKQIGYPLFFETSVLVYNKTYLDEWVEKMKVEGKQKEEELTREQIEAMSGDDSQFDFQLKIEGNKISFVQEGTEDTTTFSMRGNQIVIDGEEESETYEATYDPATGLILLKVKDMDGEGNDMSMSFKRK